LLERRLPLFSECSEVNRIQALAPTVPFGAADFNPRLEEFAAGRAPDNLCKKLGLMPASAMKVRETAEDGTGERK